MSAQWDRRLNRHFISSDLSWYRFSNCRIDAEPIFYDNKRKGWKKRIIHLIYFVYLLSVDSKTFCNASSSHEQKAKILFRKRIARIDVKNWKWTTFDIINVSWGLNEARGKKKKINRRQWPQKPKCENESKPWKLGITYTK